MRPIQHTLVAILAMVLIASCGGDDGGGGNNGNVVSGAEEVYGGHMLLAPLQSTTTYLVDTDEAVVHTWSSSYQPGNAAYLLEDGTLLRTGKVINAGRFSSTGGVGGVVEKIAWDSSVTWRYELADDDASLHHDVEVLPNGNILMIAWEYKSYDEAVAAGRDPGLLDEGELWPDTIIEVNPATDEIVWAWHVWDHLIQDYDNSKPNYGVVAEYPERIDVNYVSKPRGDADWNHINAVDYNAELDQILLSVHSFNELWIIDHSTTTAEAAGGSGGTYGKGGDLLYRWGNPAAYGVSGEQMFFGQHDAQWIPEGSPGAGHILVFNNGTRRPEGDYSTIDELSPAMNEDGSYPITIGQAFEPQELDWRYQDATATDFYAANISGVQRLPNGNTLICDGPSGHIFEVNSSGETLWSYQNTDGTPVFRVVKYPYSYAGFGQL